MNRAIKLLMALIIGLFLVGSTIPSSYAGITSKLKKTAKKAKDTAAPKVKSTATKAANKGKDTVHKADSQAKPMVNNLSDTFKDIMK